MTKIIYISILMFAMVTTAKGQNLYCSYVDSALNAYQNKQLDEARNYLERAMDKCPSAQSDAYAWHVLGFICREIHKTKEDRDFNSPARVCALNAFATSLKYDTTGEYEAVSQKSLKSIAVSFYNEAVAALDTIRFEQAIKSYEMFKKTMIIAYPDYDFISKDVTFNNVLGQVFKEKYENNRKSNDVYFQRAIKHYEITLSLDTMNYSAYYNIGVTYYNKGVDIILSLDDEVELPDLIDAQIKQADYSKLALPFLQKAYKIKPSKEIIEGFRGIYKSLNDDEKYILYTKMIEEGRVNE